MKKSKNHSKTYRPQMASLIIRIGLAGVFAYAAYDAFREPAAWIAFVPAFSTKYIAAKTSLDLISAFQSVLAVWLISGRYIKLSAVFAAALLVGIMAFNLSTFLVTFRDIGLVAAAIALIFLDD